MPDKPKKVYIAGPITGVPDYMENFARAEKYLTELGYEVVNPAKNEGNSYKEYIDKGLKQLMECDGIYLLNNWSESEGAGLEGDYAYTVGLWIAFEQKFAKMQLWQKQ